MIAEKDLIELGFIREEGGWTNDAGDKYYYYTLEIGINIYNNFCLISNSNDEVGDDGWKVYLFDNDSFEFTDTNQVKTLAKLLKDNLKKHD